MWGLPQLPAPRARNLVTAPHHTSILILSSNAAFSAFSGFLSLPHFSLDLSHLCSLSGLLEHNIFQGQGEAEMGLP